MTRGTIKLQNPEKYSGKYEIPKEKLDAAIKRATDKLLSKIDYYGDHFPANVINGEYQYGQALKYILWENDSWICGMFTGTFLLAYELTGNKKFLDVATRHMDSYEKRMKDKIRLHDHDVGFVYIPSCIAYYKLTGDERAKKIALEAAEHLYNNSYSKKGGFVLRVSTKQEEAWACRTMMDTMLNIPLFYWAHEVTGDQKFLDAAVSQTKITADYLIRPDGSSYHHYQFDVDTHAPLHGCTFQGNRDESTWSRGHAWGVLGFPVAYSYTKDESLIPLHRDVTYYMLNHLPEDNVPYWDYDFITGDEPRDSSAGVISVCGLLEACKYLPDDAPEKQIFKNAAGMMLEGVIDTCSGDIGEDYDGLIWKVTAAKKMNINIEGVATFGDFFYLEALLRYTRPEWKMYW